MVRLCIFLNSLLYICKSELRKSQYGIKGFYCATALPIGQRSERVDPRLNLENLLRAPCKFSVFSALNLDLVSKYCNLHGARGLNTGISERILGAIFGIQN